MITVGCVLADHQRLLQRPQQVGDGVGQDAASPATGLGGPCCGLTRRFTSSSRCSGGLDAGVGHQQRRFELLVERIVDLRADEDLP
jgi:hypothetical protein